MTNKNLRVCLNCLILPSSSNSKGMINCLQPYNLDFSRGFICLVYFVETIKIGSYIL